MAIGKGIIRKLTNKCEDLATNGVSKLEACKNSVVPRRRWAKHKICPVAPPTDICSGDFHATLDDDSPDTCQMTLNRLYTSFRCLLQDIIQLCPSTASAVCTRNVRALHRQALQFLLQDDSSFMNNSVAKLFKDLSSSSAVALDDAIMQNVQNCFISYKARIFQASDFCQEYIFPRLVIRSFFIRRRDTAVYVLFDEGSGRCLNYSIESGSKKENDDKIFNTLMHGITGKSFVDVGDLLLSTAVINKYETAGVQVLHPEDCISAHFGSQIIELCLSSDAVLTSGPNMLQDFMVLLTMVVHNFVIDCREDQEESIVGFQFQARDDEGRKKLHLHQSSHGYIISLLHAMKY